MTKLIVDNKEIDVPPEYTLLQACEAGGAEIPRFCFHERLSIAGNCRMCLIEVAGIPKPLAQAVDMGDVLIDQQPELLDPVLASPQSSGSRPPERTRDSMSGRLRAVT